MASFRTIDDIEAVTGKRALVRVDLNVPMANGHVTDTTRMKAVAPTINELADAGAKVILLAHFGRPKGKRINEMSLKAVVPALQEVLGKPVAFADDCTGEAAEAAVSALGDGDILLLENARFHAGEEANDGGLAEAIAKLGDVYVNDAFSAAHRAHATTEGLAHHLPAYAGRAMQAELEHLERALTAPQRPVVAIVGGAKVSTKIALLENLVSKVDALVVGGGMANTFLHALGVDVGHSLNEPDYAATARAIMAAADRHGCTIILPKDGILARKLEENAETIHAMLQDGVDHDKMILDIGPRTVELVADELNEAKTLVWNGPVGAFEVSPFDAGTVALAKYAAERTDRGLVSVAGGGDTLAALARAGVTDRFTYLSTAGGAFLEWLEGKALPGVEALKTRA